MTSEIWIAEDDRSLRWVMEKAIRREDIQVKSFENGEDLLEALEKDQPEIIISGWSFTKASNKSSPFSKLRT